jgi:predicted TIM-barrel fold metal-dependent hydrolase
MINGTTNGLFMDDPQFSPILALAEKLNVPIYLHPAPPPMAVYNAYCTGLPGTSGSRLYTAGWGWHSETAVHVLRLVLAGVFDRHPNLQVIIGHDGENLPFSLVRVDNILTKAAPHLERRVGDYLLSNIHLTTSGYFSIPPLLCAVMTFGVDKIMFSVDYPYSSHEEAMVLLNTAPLNPGDLEKIAHGNAERLLKL